MSIEWRWITILTQRSRRRLASAWASRSDQTTTNFNQCEARWLVIALHFKQIHLALQMPNQLWITACPCYSESRPYGLFTGRNDRLTRYFHLQMNSSALVAPTCPLSTAEGKFDPWAWPKLWIFEDLDSENAPMRGADYGFLGLSIAIWGRVYFTNRNLWSVLSDGSLGADMSAFHRWIWYRERLK